MEEETVNMENYRGKVVRLTAHMKTLDVVSHVSLFIGMFLVAEENRVEHIIVGTTSWSTITLDWQVPTESRGFIVFGASLQGPGHVWLRDIQFQIVSADE